MTRRLSATIAIAAVIVIPALASAQERDGEARTTSLFEVTPHASMSSSGSGVGASVLWPLKAGFSVELESTYRPSQLNALGSSVNLLYDLPSIGRVTPYVAGGIGVDQTPAVIAVPQGSLHAALKTAFTVNAGGGLRVPLNEHWGVRSDARWFNGVGRQAPERLRFYNGVTFRPRAQ